MKLLITSDWQLSVRNLPQFTLLTTQVLSLVRSSKVDYLILLGDLKETLNPVDQRVTNAIVSFLRVAVLHTEVAILLGNHDRVAVGDGSDTWAPVLRAAGAMVFDEPSILKTKDGDFCFLPYTRDPAVLKEHAAGLKAKGAGRPKGLLFFHQEVRSESAGGVDISVEDLGIVNYEHCFGGHIHTPATFDNVTYVGSPISHTWGEANELKRLLLVVWHKSCLLSTKSVPVELPGFWDADLPGFDRLAKLNPVGQRIRTRLQIKFGEDVSARMADHRLRLEAKYPGAEVEVVPVMAHDGPADVVDVNLSDDDAMIEAFIDKTLPAQSTRAFREITKSYMKARVARHGALLRGPRTKFRLVAMEAKNVLSYKELYYRFKRGMLVITGQNLDWKQRSNGSGKTNFLQIPNIALFGKTTKGQTFSDWSCRWAPEETSSVRLVLELLPGPVVLDIYRSNNPSKLMVTLDGEDVTTGNARTGQKAISDYTGLSWDLYTSSVFLDQGKVSALLDGTDGQRKAIFAQVLGTDRFSKVREVVQKEATRTSALISETQIEVNALREKIEEANNSIRRLKAGNDLAGLRKLLISQMAERESLNEPPVFKDQPKVKETFDTWQAACQRFAGINGEVSAAKRDLRELRTFPSGKCPTCGQPVKSNESAIRRAEAKLDELTSKLLKAEEDRENKEALHLKWKAAGARHEEMLRNHREKVWELKTRIENTETLIAAAEKVQEEVNRQRARRNRLRACLRYAAGALSHYRKDLNLLQWVVWALGKDGIQTFVLHSLLPRLNAAAASYSEKFSAGRIGIEFQIEGDDIELKVRNKTGGLEVWDQSRGELRLASVIVCFALMSVYPCCDLLIADEPGEGLDETNARQLAAALKELSAEYGSMLVTTHNPHILAELSSERMLRVEKKDGVSCIIA